MNQDVKDRLKEAGIKQWQIADVLHVSEGTFCRMLRHEVSPDVKKKIFDAIAELEKQD